MAKKNTGNFIILIIIILLFILMIVIGLMLHLLKNTDSNNLSINVLTENNKITQEKKTIKDIIESHGSKYIDIEKKVFTVVYAHFKYDLFDENGDSKEQYFYNIAEEIVELEKESFYLKDLEKKIDILVNYDSTNETFKMIINKDENYFENTDGQIYTNLSKAKIVPKSDFSLSNQLIQKIGSNNSYYVGTELVSEERTQLENGYFSYKEGAILARLQKGKVLNILFKENYQDKIARDVYVTTSLNEIESKYSNLAFGSSNDGYLGYRTTNTYIFLYQDEVSVYGYHYEPNEYFDTYLKDYCETGNLEKLYTDFTREWSNYFINEYNPETQSLKISFPTRGIEIDIKGNDSRGIKIYNNYYITETVEELIKAHKITLVADKDLIHITEQARRESSR